MSFHKIKSISDSRKDQKVDWEGLEERFNNLLSLWNSPSSNIGSEEERAAAKANIENGLLAILDLALTESNRGLREGDLEIAYAGGLKTLKFTEDLYGKSDANLIPVYVLLAKVNQKLKRYRQAEEFLSLCNWSVLKNPDVPLEFRIEIHRTFGVLYHSEGRFDEAAKQLAQSVYYQSQQHGPESVQVSFGYFQLASVFLSQSKGEIANSFFQKVKEIWLAYLVHALDLGEILKSHVLTNPITAQTPLSSPKGLQTFDESQRKEILDMFTVILQQQSQRFGDADLTVAKARLVYGLASAWCGDIAGAKAALLQSLTVHEQMLGATAEETEGIRTLVTRL